jgi:CubicO group peptidase (beta-lactamase class C family)
MNQSRSWLLLVLLALLTPCQAVAADDVGEQVDAYVKAEMQRQKIPGLALLVVRKGETLKSQGYGLANVEQQSTVTPETIFQSGSVGKQFTATAVMLLVHDGKLALDDPASKYLGAVPAAWEKITVRQLLSHTAGVGNYPEDFDFRRDYTEAELLERIYALPLVFAPGEHWKYSNPGYAVLGIIIGKVTGQFYGDFLQERIFKPLGMSATRIINEEDIIPRRAAGYRLVNGELKNQEWVSPALNTTADGSLYFNLVDVAKWDAGLAAEQLLPQKRLAEMWAPVRLNSGQPNAAGYGFGWFFNDSDGHRVVAHSGAWQGFTCHISRFLDDRLSVVVLTNLAGCEPVVIAKHVAGMYEPELAAKPD